MSKKIELIYGWGVNDVDCPTKTNEIVNNKKVRTGCRYYIRWLNMLTRCFSENYHSMKPTYTDCYVCEEWKYFSNFKKWVDSQPNRDWMNCELDKDLLVDGNKVYSPDTCVFISRQVNIFNSGRTGVYLRGVSYVPYRNKINPYYAKCNNPFTHKQKHLGYFDNELDAHKAWQAKKHEYACQLADLQDDPRVADALRQRYAPDKDWSSK